MSLRKAETLADIDIDTTSWIRHAQHLEADGDDVADMASLYGLRVKMCVWLGVSRGLDLAFLNAD